MDKLPKGGGLPPQTPLALPQPHPLRLTIVVCVVYGAFALAANGWGPLLTPLATQLSFSVVQIGLLFVAWLIGYLPGTLIGETLLNGYGPRLVFLTALLVLVTGMASVFFLVFFHLAWLFGLNLGAGIAGTGFPTARCSPQVVLVSRAVPDAPHPPSDAGSDAVGPRARRCPTQR